MVLKLHYPISFQKKIGPNICQVVAYGRLKTKENFQPISSESGRSRLREVPGLKRLVYILETGRSREVVGRRGSTV